MRKARVWYVISTPPEETPLTLYPGVGHGCWENAYDDPAVIEWMLAQKHH